MTIIDAHAHYIPAAIPAAVAADGPAMGVTYDGDPPALGFADGARLRPPFPGLVESPEARIARFRALGIERQVLSVWTDMFGFGLAAPGATRWHRAMNDAYAALCRAHPDRFSWLASGALQDPAGAAAELRRAVAEGGAVGATAPCNFGGVNLGELELDPYWAAIEALDLPVLIHPVELAAGPRVRRWALQQIAQYTFDTTLAVGSLIFAGVLDRFPRLKIFLPHGGGAFTWLSGRFDVMAARMPPALGNAAAAPPSSYLRRFWYDTILHDPALLRMLVAQVGADRVLLGSDDAFPPADRDPLATLRAAALPAAEAALIAGGNARALFRL